MQVMLMCCIEESRWDALPDAERDAVMKDYGDWIADLERAGQHRVSERLAAPAEARTLRLRGGKAVVTDGPFAETKEQLGGFHIVECRDVDEALDDRHAHPDAAGRRDDRGASGGARRLIDFDALYRDESRRVLATLIRLLGDFDLAEEALHEAFAAALEQWPRDGVPANPRAWLVSAGRFKAIDGIRRRARFDRPRTTSRSGSQADDADPATSMATRTLRGRPPAPGLHLLPPGAGARRAGGAHAARGLRAHDRGDRERLPRAARRRSRSASCAPRPRSATPRIPYQVPARAELPAAARRRAARGLPGVQRGLCRLVAARRSRAPTCRPRRSGWAGCWSSCCPSPRPSGLLALMLLHESRRAARTSADGRHRAARRAGPHALEPRRRSRRALALVRRALASRRFGPYTLQAAIAAVHAEAADAGARPTGPQIVGSTTCCCAREPSPVVELNRAVAVAMRDGRAAGPRADRRDPRARRARGLPAGARRARRPLPAARPRTPRRARPTSARSS